MPNSALPCRVPVKARLLRSPQASVRRRRQLHAFVELHGNVGAEQVLNLDGAFGSKLHAGAVEMGAEGNAFVLHLAQAGERHDLEAAGIREDGVGPVHKAMQPAQRRDALGPGPQHQVIRVGEKDVGTRGAHRLRRKPLHRRLRADRHERGRRDRAVRSRHFAAAGGAIGSEQAKGESVRHRHKRVLSSPTAVRLPHHYRVFCPPASATYGVPSLWVNRHFPSGPSAARMSSAG